MAVTRVSSEGVAVARSVRTKPKLLVRTVRRRAVKHAIKAIQSLFNQDFLENHRSALKNYTPYLVCGNSSSTIYKKMSDVLTRLKDAMNAKA